MGPRLISRGNRHSAIAYVSSSTASMGPRLISRGNMDGESAPEIYIAALQWGRD